MGKLSGAHLVQEPCGEERALVPRGSLGASEAERAEDIALLRAALSQLGLPSDVPDDWPALPMPKHRERLDAYFLRTIADHPFVNQVRAAGDADELSPWLPDAQERWSYLYNAHPGWRLLLSRWVRDIAKRRLAERTWNASELLQGILCRRLVDALAVGALRARGVPAGERQVEDIDLRWLCEPSMRLNFPGARLEPYEAFSNDYPRWVTIELIPPDAAEASAAPSVEHVPQVLGQAESQQRLAALAGDEPRETIRPPGRRRGRGRPPVLVGPWLRLVRALLVARELPGNRPLLRPSTCTDREWSLVERSPLETGKAFEAIARAAGLRVPDPLDVSSIPAGRHSLLRWIKENATQLCDPVKLLEMKEPPRAKVAAAALLHIAPKFKRENGRGRIENLRELAPDAADWILKHAEGLNASWMTKRNKDPLDWRTNKARLAKVIQEEAQALLLECLPPAREVELGEDVIWVGVLDQGAGDPVSSGGEEAHAKSGGVPEKVDFAD